MSYHLNSKGEPAICKAAPSNCPLDSEHFDTPAEAQVHFESLNSSSTFSNLSKEVDLSYQTGHQPDDEGVQGHDVEEYYPDFYSRPSLYRTGMTQSDAESIKTILKMRGDPDAKITIYRTVPKHADSINNGDWVSLSRDYVTAHEANMPAESQLLELEVTAKDIRSPGDSINEWGYYPVGQSQLGT